jgi:hypothetical protein
VRKCWCPGELIEDLSHDVVQQLVDDLQSHPETQDEIPSVRSADPLQYKENRRPALELPPLDDVSLTITDAGSSWTAPRVRAKPRGWRGGSEFRTAEDVARDLLIGDRGEELVYHSELQRVRSLGYEEPEKYVIWASRSDAGADHDIRSISDYGSPLWIEVKSTTGTDGLSYWPKKEFEKALKERKQYELWRVYESHTTHPIAKCFQDPISLLNRNGLRLELGTLRAVIEPLDKLS